MRVMRVAAFAIAVLCAGASAQQKPFVPESFEIPTLHHAGAFKLVPLGPELVKQDYEAYMSSIEHLQKTFSNGRWPHSGLTMDDAMKDLVNEADSFRSRTSFAYAVLTPDGAKGLGTVYIRPSRKAEFDAVVTMWVTKEQFDRGFDQVLFDAVRNWMDSSWPFASAGYPKRGMTQEQWDGLPNRLE